MANTCEHPFFIYYYEYTNKYESTNEPLWIYSIFFAKIDICKNTSPLSAWKYTFS